MFEWMVNNLKAVLIFTAGVVFTVIVTRYKEGIKKGTNFVIDSILSWVRIYFLDRARDLARARTLAHDFDPARDLDFDLDRARSLARGLDLALARALSCARALARVIDRARVRDRTRDLVRDLDRARALASALDRGLIFEQVVNHLDTARKAVNMIEKELKKGWTWGIWLQTFELGKALVDALVAYLEILPNPVPKDLLIALRQPGLLTPVNEFPPNDLGICGLAGNVWKWPSTTNKKGDHMICGGAWTEEKYDPDKEEWRPPSWRDINLGFRCVCDWDKICEVKEPVGQ